jgi:uncharacterized protein YecT (DUF1311 family)
VRGRVSHNLYPASIGSAPIISAVRRPSKMHFHQVLRASASVFLSAFASICVACPSGGQVALNSCQVKLRSVESQLNKAYSVEEIRLKASFGGEPYGGLEGLIYYEEALKAFRASNRAWQIARNAECAYEPFASGMNAIPDAQFEVAMLCRIELTRKRVKYIRGIAK